MVKRNSRLTSVADFLFSPPSPWNTEFERPMSRSTALPELHGFLTTNALSMHLVEDQEERDRFLDLYSSVVTSRPITTEPQCHAEEEQRQPPAPSPCPPWSRQSASAGSARVLCHLAPPTASVHPLLPAMEHLLRPIPVLVRPAHGTSGVLPQAMGEDSDLISATGIAVFWPCRPTISPYGPDSSMLKICRLARNEKIGKVCPACPIDVHSLIDALPRCFFGHLVRRELLPDRLQLRVRCAQPVKRGVVLSPQPSVVQCLAPPKSQHPI